MPIRPLTSVLALLCAAAFCRGAESPRVAHLDLTRHMPEDQVELERAGEREFVWSLSAGLPQKLRLNLGDAGIDPGDYDELRFEIMPLGSQVSLHTAITGLPTPDDISSWYLKFKTRAGEWSSGRYELDLDDDGIYFSRARFEEPDGTMILTLNRRTLGTVNEPKWRKARIRNPRLVRRLLDAELDYRDCRIELDGGDIRYTYIVSLSNRTDQARTVRVDPDTDETVKYFSIAAPEEVSVAPGAETKVEIQLSMPRLQALRLPALFSEPAYVSFSLPDVEDSDVTPLLGYRRKPLWGCVPCFTPLVWSPPAMRAFLDARQAVIPALSAWEARVVRTADAAMQYVWPMPENILPGHTMSYRSPKGNTWLKPEHPTNFFRHVCPVTKEVFEGKAGYNAAYVGRYYVARASDVRTCALAWLMTGNAAYADKALEILDAFAEAHPDMPVAGMRSTSGGSRLGCNTLLGSYVLPALGEGWSLLAGYAADSGRRERIEAFLLDEALRVGRHSTEYSNQTAEHIRGSASVALAVGFWPLAAEKIHGEFGFHDMVDGAFSEDGIGHEAGAYHHSVFHALNEFAAFTADFGIQLYTPRFKRVFDGSIVAGVARTPYEAAYRVFREPAWLAKLEHERRHPSDMTAFHGVLGIPEASAMPAVSALMEGAGYVFLRKGNAADNTEIRINYIKTFDRTESDKLSTTLHRNGMMLDQTTGRIAYSSPRTKWMYETAAHNAIVIDGQSANLHTDARLLTFDPSTERPLALLGTSGEAPFYEGVTQLRGVALVENLFIVFDRVTCDRPRTIDRYQHGRGKATLSCEANPVETLPALPPPAEFAALQGGPCGREARVTFENGLTMLAVTDRDAELWKGVTLSGWQGAEAREVTFLRVAETDGLTCLAAYAFGEQAALPELTITQNTAQRIEFRIVTPTREHTLVVEPAAGKAAFAE